MPQLIAKTSSRIRSTSIVIGAGPGGYVAAIRRRSSGMRSACVEREYLGGTCLNVGCIPSKALLDSSERVAMAKHDFAKHGITVGNVSVDLAEMMQRKDDVVKGLTGGVGMLFKKNKVEHVKGHGKITVARHRRSRSRGRKPADAEGQAHPHRHRHRADRTPRAASSTGRTSAPPPTPSTFAEVPKTLIVVGAGYIGVELGSVWNRLGQRSDRARVPRPRPARHGQARWPASFSGCSRSRG